MVDIDQSPIGRTPRSNPATYTGVFDHIRRLFSQTTEAKVRGYLPGRFSFNVRGGRCEACAGDGTIKIEMHFLPDVYVPCEVCHGRPLQPRHPRGHLQGQEHRRGARPVLRGGAGLLRQPAAHRPPPADPGRRRPRLRAARPAGPDPVGRRGPAGQAGHRAVPRGRPATPSTSSTSRPPACTSRTSASCSRCSGRLVDQGNTVVVIEHNLDVIKTADWIIDLGPEGGDRGGRVVAEGTPEQVAKTAGQLHRRGAPPGAGRSHGLSPAGAGPGRGGARRARAGASGRRWEAHLHRGGRPDDRGPVESVSPRPRPRWPRPQ